MIRHELASSIAGVMLTATALLAVSPAPALAAGSRIDVGWTDRYGNWIR